MRKTERKPEQKARNNTPNPLAKPVWEKWITQAQTQRKNQPQLPTREVQTCSPHKQ
jgi:hypothetical protein